MAGEIFISYRRSDRTWARLLHELLRVQGVEAWYDAHVGAGEDWRVATAQALEESRIFVLLFSAAAAQSGDIAKELAAAVLEKKLIVPVRLENIAPKGAFLYELASRNWINAYEDTEGKLAELAQGLARLVRSGGRDESLLPFTRAESGVAARAGRRQLVAAMAAAGVMAAAAAAWWLWPAPHWTVVSSRPFIAGLALEGEPAFSPDGRMIAYAAGTDMLSRKIYVRNLAGGDGIKVTGGVFEDVSPSWSQDGSRIAYVAVKPGEPCRIMVATVPSGGAREAGRCAYDETTVVSWQPGTPYLYFFDRPPQVASLGTSQGAPDIMRLNLDSGEKTPLARPDSNPILGMIHLQCSPDGKYLLMLGGENASTYAVVIRELSSGKEKLLGKILVSGSAAWSEDSRSVLMTTASGIGSKITAYPIDGGAPYFVYAAAVNVSHLAAGKGGLLALETDPGRQNLARLAPKPSAQPDIVDSANGLSWSPSFAPDGTLAFLSNRSGTNAVWIKKPGGAPVLLYDAGVTPIFRLAFSPDGKYLAMTIATADGVTITILTVNGSTLTTFHSSALGTGAPTWSPDSKEVIAFDKNILTYMQISIADPARRRPAAPRLWGGILHHDGATYATRRYGGYWRIDRGEQLVTAKYPVWGPPPALLGDELLVPDFSAPGGPRILAQPLAGGPDRVLAYAPGMMRDLYGRESGIATNPHTGEVVYVAAVQSDTNIDLLTLARK